MLTKQIFSTHTSTLCTPLLLHVILHLIFLSHAPNITEVQISIHDTFKVLTELDPSKSMGIDGIGPALLKHCATHLCTPLCHLFSVSLHTARIPLDWKVHKITPVFKSGNKNSVQNYRPISLLSSVSKVLEKLIYDKVLDFLYPSFSTSQFGFLPDRSSLQQLLIFLNDIHNNSLNHLQTMWYILTFVRLSTLYHMTDY